MVGCQITHKRHSPRSNSLPAPLLWLYSEEQDYRWTQTSILEGGDQPHSSLRTAIYPCGPRKWHYFLFTARDQQGIFTFSTFTWRRWLFYVGRRLNNFSVSTLFFPTWHRLLILQKKELPVGVTSSQIHQEQVCFQTDLSSHRKDAVHLSILGTECCDPPRIQKH